MKTIELNFLSILKQSFKFVTSSWKIFFEFFKSCLIGLLLTMLLTIVVGAVLNLLFAIILAALRTLMEFNVSFDQNQSLYVSIKTLSHVIKFLLLYFSAFVATTALTTKTYKELAYKVKHEKFFENFIKMYFSTFWIGLKQWLIVLPLIFLVSYFLPINLALIASSILGMYAFIMTSLDIFKSISLPFVEYIDDVKDHNEAKSKLKNIPVNVGFNIWVYYNFTILLFVSPFFIYRLFVPMNIDPSNPIVMAQYVLLSTLIFYIYSSLVAPFATMTACLYYDLSSRRNFKPVSDFNLLSLIVMIVFLLLFLSSLWGGFVQGFNYAANKSITQQSQLQSPIN